MTFVLIGFIGLVLGSFANVVIYRLPLMLSDKKNISLSFPSSHCPECKKALKKRQNIPLVSFIFYRGKCAYCHKSISWRYPCVELIICGLFILGEKIYGGNNYAVVGYCLLVEALVILSFIDLDNKVLPDLITIPLIIMGWFYNFNGGFTSLEGSITGSIYAYLAFNSVAKGMRWWKQRTALGGGDIKLFTAIGAWMGGASLLFVTLVAAVLTLIMILATRNTSVMRGEREIPFGPGIAVAALFYCTSLGLFPSGPWMNIVFL